MSRQGYQNIVNVHNEENQSQSSSASSFTNPLSHLGLNMSEEELQYSSYYNTYMDKRRSRNSSIVVAVIGIFIFFAFLNFIGNPQSSAHTSEEAEAAIVSTNSETPTPNVVPDMAKKTVAPGAVQEPLVPPTTDMALELSKLAFDRFQEETASTDTTKVLPGCEGTILILAGCEKSSFYENNFYNEHCNYVGFERAEYLKNLFGNQVITTDRRRRRALKKSGKASRNLQNEEDDSNSVNNSTTGTIGTVDMTEAEFLETVVVSEAVAESVTDYALSELPVKWPIPSYIYALSPFRQTNPNNIQHYREMETVTPLSKLFQLPINVNYSETPTEMEKLSSELYSKLNSGDMCGKVAVISWDNEYIPQLAQKLGCGPLQGCPSTYDSMEYDEVWSLKYVFRPTPLPDIMQGMEYEEVVPKSEIEKMRESIGWEMYGHRVKQGFDPLRLSAEVGDYDISGVVSGGRWMGEDR